MQILHPVDSAVIWIIASQLKVRDANGYPII